MGQRINTYIGNGALSNLLPISSVMRKKSNERFTINQRPIYNKYCIMTTLHMLELCRESYKKTLRKLEKHKQSITNRYYEAIDIPTEVKEEITETVDKIFKCEKILEDIETAINILQSPIVDSLSAVE